MITKSAVTEASSRKSIPLSMSNTAVCLMLHSIGDGLLPCRPVGRLNVSSGSSSAARDRQLDVRQTGTEIQRTTRTRGQASWPNAAAAMRRSRS